jgi:hypothetical protein
MPPTRLRHRGLSTKPAFSRSSNRPLPTDPCICHRHQQRQAIARQNHRRRRVAARCRVVVRTSSIMPMYSTADATLLSSHDPTDTSQVHGICPLAFRNWQSFEELEDLSAPRESSIGQAEESMQVPINVIVATARKSNLTYTPVDVEDQEYSPR